MSAWTHPRLKAEAQQLVLDVGGYFAAIAIGEDMEWHLPHDGEDYDAFADRSFDLCADMDGDGIILAWRWPGLDYVTALLASPRDGHTTVAIHTEPRELH